MQFFPTRSKITLAISLLLCGCLPHVVMALSPQKTPKREVVQIKVPVDDEAPCSERWVGVDCISISPIIRSQLKLDYGLAVLDLAKESPAADAGLRPYDILVSLNSKHLQSPSELTRVIQGCSKDDVFIEIVREGRRKTIPLKLRRRPACQKHSIILVADEDGRFDLDRARKKIEKHIKSRKPDEPLNRFELIFVKRAVEFEGDELIEPDSGRPDRGNRHAVYEFSRDAEEAREVKWIRLHSDLRQNLALTRELQDRLEQENRNLQALLSKTKKLQSQTIRELKFQLDQIETREDQALYDELVKQRKQIEGTLLRWEQMVDRLRCYQHSLRDACPSNGEKK